MPRRAGTLVVGGIIIVGWLAWWAPLLTLNLARLGALHLRFRAEMATADLLFAMHRDGAARRVLARVIRRNRRKLRAARRRPTQKQ